MSGSVEYMYKILEYVACRGERRHLSILVVSEPFNCTIRHRPIINLA